MVSLRRTPKTSVDHFEYGRIPLICPKCGASGQNYGKPSIYTCSGLHWNDFHTFWVDPFFKADRINRTFECKFFLIRNLLIYF